MSKLTFAVIASFIGWVVFYFDCSHDVPVKKCKETRQVELAWDINNITMRGRRCHVKHDKLY